MPTSHFKQIPDIVAAAIEINPKSILEIGIGCGKYGALLREYLTVWDHYFEPFDMQRVRIDGIEIHDMYSSAPAWSCYNHIFLGDIRDFILVDKHYDMVLMVDVLEHFEVADGIGLLHRLLKHANCLLVALPASFFPTVEVWGNPHEIHKAEYPPALLEAEGFVVEVKRADDSSVMVVRKP